MMGRQINFYATELDLMPLFEKIIKKGIFVMNKHGEILDIEMIKQIIEENLRKDTPEYMLYLTFPQSKIHFVKSKSCDKKFIKFLESEVIEFSFCKCSRKEIKDCTRSKQYIEEHKDNFDPNSDEYITIINGLPDIPNPNYIENGIEEGRFYYTKHYYIGDLCLRKAEQLDKIYSCIARYIRTNFMKGEYLSYIGKDAYKLYLDGLFIPCSGKHRIEF